MSIVLAYRSLDGFAIALIIHSLDPTGVERWNYFLHLYDAPHLLSCRRQINSLLRGGGDA